MKRMSKNELERQERLLAIVTKLHALGLSWDEAEDFPFIVPRIYSGYKMGEKVQWYFKNERLFVEDYTYEYAKSCQWRAKHGNIIMRFDSKKALKDFVVKAKKGTLTETDVKQYINTNSSVFVNGKIDVTIRQEILLKNNYIIKDLI